MKHFMLVFVVVLVLATACTSAPTPTPVPPTPTTLPTATPVPPTATPVPPTATATVVVRTVTPTVGQIFIEGVYYNSNQPPGNIALLRFFKDGTVLNSGGRSANIQAAWAVFGPQMTLQNANANWHGKYTIVGNQISFGIAPPGQSQIGNNWEGTYQPDKLTLKIRGDSTIYEFIRTDVGK